MSIKSIPLKTWEVQAILDNRKSTTRRVVKMDRSRIYKAACAAGRWSETFGGEIPDEVAGWYAREVAKPPYRPGDILWVRETWCDPSGEGYPYWYKADFPLHWDADEVEIGIPVDLVSDDYIWSPSIHMPKSAARLFLRVKSVRVERLRDITIDGIEQEGVTLTFPLKKLIESEHLKQFSTLWNSTIKPADIPRYGWDANPFVWVVEFERCEKPEIKRLEETGNDR